MSDTNSFEYCVYIGRFQPVHNGHLAMLEAAGRIAQRVVVVLGSSNRGASSRNPWSALERMRLIRAAVAPELLARLDFAFVPDRLADDATWVRDVENQVASVIGRHGRDNPKIAYIGHRKDSTTYYLSLFPHWSYHEGPVVEGLNATDVRAEFFGGARVDSFADRLHSSTLSFLGAYRGTEEFLRLAQERLYLDKHRVAWSCAPYPPVFVTADVCVHWRGEILCIRRAGWPGKGMLALPGGFIEQNELLLDAALRELNEETGLKLKLGTDAARLLATKLFEHPERSLRGRTITQVAYIDVSGLPHKPDTHAGDDAGDIVWVNLKELEARELEFFEDHGDVAREMTGYLRA